MQVADPFHFDSAGRTAQATEEEHIRDMIEEVLFTVPGERVNRPTFGCGLLNLVFEPNSDALAGATQAMVQGSLVQWLGDVIEVEAVDVRNQDARLDVTVVYRTRKAMERQVARFQRGGV